MELGANTKTSGQSFHQEKYSQTNEEPQGKINSRAPLGKSGLRVKTKTRV